METYTCGVGIRASVTARTATAWHFVTDQRIGTELSLEDEAGPLSMPRLKEFWAPSMSSRSPREYKAHVGRTLFGLDAAQYDEVLRLLYWLRQPQVGEDIEPAKLAAQLSQALPQLDEQAVRAAGDTFDELTAVGEQIERRARQLRCAHRAGGRVTAYARAVVAERARAVAQALRSERRARVEVRNALARAAAGPCPGRLGSGANARPREPGSTQTMPRACGRSRTARSSATSDGSTSSDRIAGQDAALAQQAESRFAAQRGAVEHIDLVAAARAHSGESRCCGHRDRLRDLDQRQRESVPGSSVPTPTVLDGLRLSRVGQLPSVVDALDQCLAMRCDRPDLRPLGALAGVGRRAGGAGSGGATQGSADAGRAGGRPG